MGLLLLRESLKGKESSLGLRGALGMSPGTAKSLSDSLQITSAYHTSVSPPEKLVDKSSFFARGQTVLLFKFLAQEESWHSTSLTRETH